MKNKVKLPQVVGRGGEANDEPLAPEWDKAIKEAEEIVAEIQRDVSGVDARRYYAEKFLSLFEIKAEDQGFSKEAPDWFDASFVEALHKFGWMRVVVEKKEVVG